MKLFHFRFCTRISIFMYIRSLQTWGHKFSEWICQKISRTLLPSFCAWVLLWIVQRKFCFSCSILWCDDINKRWKLSNAWEWKMDLFSQIFRTYIMIIIPFIVGLIHGTKSKNKIYTAIFNFFNKVEAFWGNFSLKYITVFDFFLIQGLNDDAIFTTFM